MRKAFLLVGVLAFLAAPAFAYVQPSSLASQTKLKGPVAKEQSDGSTGSGTLLPLPIDVPPTIDPIGGDLTVKPVPEPGTMAMASMGLLAIGAALRKRSRR